jgi:hypothetical protein
LVAIGAVNKYIENVESLKLINDKFKGMIYQKLK